MKLLLIALSFFTRIPIIIKRTISKEEFYKSMLLLPIVGLILGLIFYLSSFLLQYINYFPIQALIIVIFYFILTGGIHFDGLSDSIDALFSNKNQQELLSILKDPYVGSFGSIGITLTILTFYICNLYIFENQEFILLVLFPIIGRFGAIELGAFFKPNVNILGLGYHFCKVDKPIYFWIYFTLIGLVSFYFCSIIFLAYIVVVLLNLLIGFYLINKTEGISGDFLGLIIELDQNIFLFSFIIIRNILFYLNI